MITLLLPAAILWLGGDVGRYYLAAGVVSLGLDWFVFYLPGFPRDREHLGELLGADVSRAQADEVMSYTKWQIFHVQWQSLGWWVLTSWRWLQIFRPGYRESVGLMFLMAALGDPILRARLDVMALKETK